MKLKILHTADFHLGLSFRNHPEAREKLIPARLKSLQRLVELANEKKVEILAVAGDLFDKTSVKTSLIVETVQILNKFEGNAVLVLPGNHDYIASESPLWNRFKDEANENIIVLGEKKSIQLDDYNLPVVVYPGPCHAKHCSDSAIEWVQEVNKNPKLIHIGIAHGSLEGVSPDFDSQYFPMMMNQLRGAGVDFWLMGHTHITWPAKPDKNDIIFNPGTPEPDGFDCSHEGRAFLHTIDEDKKRETEILNTGAFSFKKESETITSESDIDKLFQKYEEEQWKKIVLKLQVSGRLESELYDKWKERRHKLRDYVLELKLDDQGVKRKITPNQIKNEFPENSFPEQLLTTLSSKNEEEFQMAYELIKEVQQ